MKRRKFLTLTGATATAAALALPGAAAGEGWVENGAWAIPDTLTPAWRFGWATFDGWLELDLNAVYAALPEGGSYGTYTAQVEGWHVEVRGRRGHQQDTGGERMATASETGDEISLTIDRIVAEQPRT